MEGLPDASSLPITEPSPAGHAAGETVAAGKRVPSNAFFEHIDDSGERCTRASVLAPTLGSGLGGKEWLNDVPEAVGDKRFDHPVTLQRGHETSSKQEA